MSPSPNDAPNRLTHLKPRCGWCSPTHHHRRALEPAARLCIRCQSSPTKLVLSLTAYYPVCLHSAGFGFSGENGYALMQRSTSAVSFCWSQALKKSACMVEAAPEESVTVPEVVGIGNRTSMVRAATG